MEIISPGQKNLIKMWSASKTKIDNYRPIKYMLEEVVEDGLLLCNTVTGELILLSEQEKEFYNQRQYNAEAFGLELARKRFLVPYDFCEEKSIEQLRGIVRHIHNSKELQTISILPTTDCNARCFYCYQSDNPHKTMTLETMDKVIDFIVKNSGSHAIKLLWFGGEPTLGCNKIDYICDQLSAANVKYYSTMISNSYLFSEELASRAKEKWKMQSIQITLDGTEAVYNNTKKYVSADSSPYRKVLQNIHCLLQEKIEVIVRLNLDLHNKEDLYLLIEELYAEFSRYELFKVYVHVIYDNVGYAPMEHKEGQAEELETIKEDLELLLAQKGIGTQNSYALPHLKWQQCMADNDQCIQCSPDGLLGKCEHYIFEHIVGNIENGITDKKEINYWKESVLWESCRECQLTPWCYHLAHCPASEKTCYEITKNNKIEFYKQSMQRVYEKWKQQREQSN